MPEDWEPVVPFERTFDAALGLEIVACDVEGEGVVRGRVLVRAALLGATGAVHSGIYAAVAESLASRGTALAVIPEGQAAMGLSNDTTVLAEVRAGRLDVAARLLARLPDAWVWTVEARDGDGRPCAFSRVTVAVRPLPAT